MYCINEGNADVVVVFDEFFALSMCRLRALQYANRTACSQRVEGVVLGADPGKQRRLDFGSIFFS